MGHAGQDALAELVGAGATDALLADKDEDPAGVVDALGAVPTAVDMVSKKGQHLFFHLIVEKQIDDRADLFTVHNPYSSSVQFG
jgi:hypothetical protein